MHCCACLRLQYFAWLQRVKTLFLCARSVSSPDIHHRWRACKPRIFGFANAALDRFLAANGYTGIIRGHMGKQCVELQGCCARVCVYITRVFVFTRQPGPAFKSPNAGACSPCSARLTTTTRAGSSRGCVRDARACKPLAQGAGWMRGHLERARAHDCADAVLLLGLQPGQPCAAAVSWLMRLIAKSGCCGGVGRGREE